MSEMTYELNQMHERAAVTECLAAVTVANENGRHVPTVIIVPDSLAEAQQKKCASIFGVSLKSCATHTRLTTKVTGARSASG